MFKIERRYLDRFKVHSAKIKYILGNGNSSTVNLIDITKISVLFNIDHILLKGESVTLSIIVKGKKSILVKGNVVRTFPKSGNKGAQAVVQFDAFGTDERYNSMESYEQLAQLEEEYLQEEKTLKNIYKA